MKEEEWPVREMVRWEQLGNDLNLEVHQQYPVLLPPCYCEFKGNAMASLNACVYQVQVSSCWQWEAAEVAFVRRG